MQGGSLLIMLVLMVGLMYFMSRLPPPQYPHRLDSLNNLQNGTEVITIGCLYGPLADVATARPPVLFAICLSSCRSSVSLSLFAVSFT